MANKTSKNSGEALEAKMKKASAKLDKSFESKSEKIDKLFNAKSEKVENYFDGKSDGFKRAIVTWLRTSQLFDGMVNTPARILINVLSMLTLYVWGFWVFVSEEGMLGWGITLLVLLFMQAISVRFVFNAGGVADELQKKRSHKALSEAYRVIRSNIVLTSLIVMALVFLGDRAGQDWYSYLFNRYGYFHMDNYRGLFVAIFAVALVSFQKYFSYGMKGEPFTVRENSKIKD